MEVILQDRDPRDAWFFTQRICGVCTTVHAITSVRAVENALDLQIPLNAELIRNLIMTGHALHDHIVHFYHLSALDWVDVVSATKGDPAKTAALADKISPWPRNSRREFQAVRDKLVSFVERGQLGIFKNGYWGHPAMKLSPEVNLLGAAHYLQALEYQKKANQAVAILGAKTPNIQNLAVGGVANPINLDNQAALNMQRLYKVKSLLAEVRDFVHQVYLLDVAAIGAMYPEWLGYGAGVTNYLAVPDLPTEVGGQSFDLPGGTIFDADLNTTRKIESFADPYFKENVAECIAHSWYDGDWTRHPWEEETVPNYTEFEPQGKYTWVKAPRFDGRPMQVGPLAQVLVGYASGHQRTRDLAGHFLKVASSVAGTQLGPEVLHSTLGRHAARAIRAAMISDLALEHWDRLVNNIASGDVETFSPFEFPQGEQRGFGFHEAPRGALSHWVVIRDGKIANYQAVVPSTWNAGPRDDKDQLGPYEASLIGNPIADADKPLEVLRTVHSFDPCLACAIHALDPEGREISTVQAL
jgi:hydrogenase large subunit